MQLWSLIIGCIAVAAIGSFGMQTGIAQNNREPGDFTIAPDAAHFEALNQRRTAVNLYLKESSSKLSAGAVKGALAAAQSALRLARAPDFTPADRWAVLLQLGYVYLLNDRLRSSETTYDELVKTVSHLPQEFTDATLQDLHKKLKTAQTKEKTSHCRILQHTIQRIQMNAGRRTTNNKH